MRAPAKLRYPSGLAALRRDHLLAQMMTKAKPLPPRELVEQLLDYELTTGLFLRKKKYGKYEIGSIVGNANHDGYIYIRIKGKGYAAHRLAWLLVANEDPAELEIDHIDGNRQNNSFSNLRLANRTQNNRNAKTRRDNNSGYKGVHYSKDNGKWRAVIHCDNKRTHLGYFPTAGLAHMAYCKAAAELHGDFARAA
jgi:hypothetical protein